MFVRYKKFIFLQFTKHNAKVQQYFIQKSHFGKFFLKKVKPRALKI